MSAHSAIEWTDHTWPVVQGCDYDSPGCVRCYAVGVIWRLAHNPDPKISAPLKGLVAKTTKGDLVWTGKLALREDRLGWPLSWRKPARIFVPSHGDVFHEDVPDEFLDRIFAVMALCPQHTFQVLTKRATRMRAYLTQDGLLDRLVTAACRIDSPDGANWAADIHSGHDKGLPLPNVWLGVSVEDQRRANERIPELLAAPAAVRFVSAEPLIEAVDLTRITVNGCDRVYPLKGYMEHHPRGTLEHGRLDWVIVGGESGQVCDARPMDLAWARTIVEQCRAAGVAVFVKQLGRNPVDSAKRVEGDAPAVATNDLKGGDPAEWPEDLRLREFPTVKVSHAAA